VNEPTETIPSADAERMGRINCAETGPRLRRDQPETAMRTMAVVMIDVHTSSDRPCVDGLTGFPEAIEAVFPQAWVQTCIVHQIRSSLRYVNYRDRRTVAKDLQPIYTAANADDALRELERFEEQWGERYPIIATAWRERWEHIIPFLSLPSELRRA
jgi:hypothetical protein